MIKIFINSVEFSPSKITEWEKSKIIFPQKILEWCFGIVYRATNADEFAKEKSNIPPEKMRAALKGPADFMGFGASIVARLSMGRRKISTIEIDIDFCNAEKLLQMYFDFMLNNTKENLYTNLRANPEHFLLSGTKDHIQEVIEITAGVPMPVRFFIHYGDERGMVSTKETDYPYQAFGVSYAATGLAIGAVRHQMKDTDTGCHIKLSVEFPTLLPDKNIRKHQYHLACEFYNWFSEMERRLCDE